ncbi:MAG: hypothetical protein AAGJ82_11820 [Bacteroidota bacterium]
MDNWYYSLYHLNANYAFVDQLGDQVDIFQCSVGDADHSFDFKYYKDGQLRRSYCATNPSYRKGELEITVDVGASLPSEHLYLKSDDEFDKVLNIAFAQGAKLSPNPADIRAYSYSVEKLDTNPS